MNQTTKTFTNESYKFLNIVVELMFLFPSPDLGLQLIRIGDQEGKIKKCITQRSGAEWDARIAELSLLVQPQIKIPTLKSPIFYNPNITLSDLIQIFYSKIDNKIIKQKDNFRYYQAHNYGYFLQELRNFLFKFDDIGPTTMLNQIIWSLILSDIDPIVNTEESFDRLYFTINSYHTCEPFETEFSGKIMLRLTNFIEKINDSEILTIMYQIYSSIIKIPPGQKLLVALKQTKFHFARVDDMQSLTLYTGTIFLNSLRLTKGYRDTDEQVMRTLTAYYLIVLIHESGHYFSKVHYNSFDNMTKEIYEYDNMDAGIFLETILMPSRPNYYNRRIPHINNFMAEFLLNPDSWNLQLPVFQEQLKELCFTKKQPKICIDCYKDQPKGHYACCYKDYVQVRQRQSRLYN